jgi:archaellum component FlaC
MYFLASAGISFIGYFGAGAALILTVVRPVVRGYEYVRKRLATIGEEIVYPREDIQTMKAMVEEIKNAVERLEQRLDTESEYSWAAEQVAALDEQQRKLEALRQRTDDLAETNKLDHEKISRDAQNAMSQAMADAAIVSHVREIIRFFKES